jgi:hypothetical protein
MALSFSGGGAACLCSAFDSDITCRLTRGPIVTRKVVIGKFSDWSAGKQVKLPRIPFFRDVAREAPSNHHLSVYRLFIADAY